MRALASLVRDPSGNLLVLRVAKDSDWFAECFVCPGKMTGDVLAIATSSETSCRE